MADVMEGRPVRGRFPYKVRVSPRARRCLIRVAADGDVTVVVPRGFAGDLIPALVESKRRWIEGKLELFAGQRPAKKGAVPGLPERIELAALGESWQVKCRPARTSRVVAAGERGTLVLYGAVHDRRACREALCRWLRMRARERLCTWLSDLAREHGFRFCEALIRGQRTRWASCSAAGRINLNYKLLFLPGEMVRLVLLHELCHTRHLDHSRRFWQLLESLEPGCRLVHRRMRQAWRMVPAWADELN